MFVSVEILGGLGNHLFQIALILHFLKMSQRCNKYRQIVFKYSHDTGNKYNLPRKTFWKTLFNDQFNVLGNDEFNKINFSMFYEGEHHKFAMLPYDSNDNILFKGYFQSFKYIDDDIRQQMINYLYSNKDIFTTSLNKYDLIKQFFGNEIGDNDMVSLHIRRTDYILESHYHYNLDLDYYKRAIEITGKKYIVIFSDDIEWCKTNITTDDLNCNAIYFVDINNVEIEFITMSLFKHNIIANSTFSLWASFIGSHQDKIVVCPKKWFSHNSSNITELHHKYITHTI